MKQQISLKGEIQFYIKRFKYPIFNNGLKKKRNGQKISKKIEELNKL